MHGSLHCLYARSCARSWKTLGAHHFCGCSVCWSIMNPGEAAEIAKLLDQIDAIKKENEDLEKQIAKHAETASTSAAQTIGMDPFALRGVVVLRTACATDLEYFARCLPRLDASRFRLLLARRSA